MISIYKEIYPKWENDQRKWYAEGVVWRDLLNKARREGNDYWAKIYEEQMRACFKGIIGFE